jgi:hypothetical protein
MLHQPSAYDRFAPPPYLRNLRQLTVHDDEYHRVSYNLKASVQSMTVRVLSIHAVNSPQQDAMFESNHVGVTVLDSWVNGADLPEQNSIHNVVAHGGRFRITDADKGAIFTVGTIPMDDPAALRGGSSGPMMFEMIHFRVAVGRSFVVDPQQVGVHGIPSGYDSIVIHKPFEDDPTRYYHEYILNDESRIYPDFVVNFVFDFTADRMKLVPNCECCDARAAVVYCMQDNAKLCEVCDRDMHSKSKIYERHNRVLLNEMQTTVGLTMCREHTNMPVQFFDPVAHLPVCIHCKMSGSHSSGEYSTHQLVPIQEAYQSSMEDLERERLIVEERRKTIYAQIASIDRRMTQVNQNHEKCQDQIYEIVQRVVQVLHEETQSKLAALLSDESELRRQLEYYGWMEGFLNYQKSAINPVEFLQVFKSHSSLLAAAPSEIVDGASNVRADIRVLGRLDVVVDDTNAAVQPAPQRIESAPRGGGGGGGGNALGGVSQRLPLQGRDNGSGYRQAPSQQQGGGGGGGGASMSRAGSARGSAYGGAANSFRGGGRSDGGGGFY